MSPGTNLWVSTALRGLQILFGIVILGNAATLAKGHYDGIDENTRQELKSAKVGLSSVPFILPWATAAGALTFIAGIVNLCIAWTDYFREYIEMLIDIVIVLLNVVAGTLLFAKIRGKNCSDESPENRFGSSISSEPSDSFDDSDDFDYSDCSSPRWPYTGGLGSVDIFRGACWDALGHQGCLNTDMHDRNIFLNKRCKQCSAESAVIWLTVALLLGTLTMTYLRFRKNH